MFNYDLFSDALVSLTVQFSCHVCHAQFNYRFEAHISGAKSRKYQKGKGVMVSSEVKFDFRLCSSNNVKSTERSQLQAIFFTV